VVFVVEKVALGQIFSEHFAFSLRILVSSTASHSSSSIYHPGLVQQAN
jgi:hypothetical protein